MSNFKIITDSGSDLPKATAESLGLTVSPLFVNFRGATIPDSVDEGIQEMYAGLRAGEPASTSAINPQQWSDAIEGVLAEGLDALVLTFSSGLSTTYQSAVIAANELAEKYPQRKIRVVDTLAASLGQGLLVWYACKKQQEGMALDALADWVTENRFRLCHWFTVDDLMYLKRGGRVSAATALVGTMLNIKPVLHVDDEGHLISKAKVRGRKAAIEALAAKMGQLGLPGENDTVFICHGDCLEDAKKLEAIVKEKFGVKEVFIGYTGAVIGSHSGPGTLALFFLGEHR
ncbi:MAG: DegV family protein [Oscillospiraceae bacterium]|nr:DegV family protein [Oscillospiraceae bacterium]